MATCSELTAFSKGLCWVPGDAQRTIEAPRRLGRPLSGPAGLYVVEIRMLDVVLRCMMCILVDEAGPR